MNNEESSTPLKQIDFGKIFKSLKRRKRVYFYTLPATFVIASLLIICVPRYYQCEVTLAPELSEATNGMGSSLSSLASSFGVSMMNKLGKDAISPEFYPNVFSSTNFEVSLFNTKVKSTDGKISTTYYNYLRLMQKSPWWGKVKYKLISLFKKKKTYGPANGKGAKITPFYLTEEQDGVARAIGKAVTCSVDKKTAMITITVTDQDPLICATIANVATLNLQKFITEYRTNKSCRDLQHTETLYLKAKSDYDKARQTYAAYSDANQDVILESVKSKTENLENEMQLKYNIYSMLTTQLQAARAKVQERTPAFTTLQSPQVPLRAAGPKRTIFVVFLTFIAFIVSSAYILIKEHKS